MSNIYFFKSFSGVKSLLTCLSTPVNPGRSSLEPSGKSAFLTKYRPDHHVVCDPHYPPELVLSWSCRAVASDFLKLLTCVSLTTVIFLSLCSPQFLIHVSFLFFSLYTSLSLDLLNDMIMKCKTSIFCFSGKLNDNNNW